MTGRDLFRKLRADTDDMLALIEIETERIKSEAPTDKVKDFAPEWWEWHALRDDLNRFHHTLNRSWNLLGRRDRRQLSVVSEPEYGTDHHHDECDDEQPEQALDQTADADDQNDQK